MVNAPALPGSIVQLTDKPLVETVEVEELEIDVRISPLTKALSILDVLTPAQIAEVYIWLAEHPMEGVDPVRLAIASFESLTDEELLEYFQQLKAKIDPELWKLLTE